MSDVRASNASNRANAAAAIVFALLCGLVGLTFFEAREQQRHEVRQTVAAVAAVVAARIRAFHGDRLHFLDALAKDWLAQPSVDRAWFAHEVARIRSGLDGILAMIWVGPDRTIRWVEPAAGNAAVEGLDIRKRPFAAPVIEAAARDGGHRMTPPFELLRGMRGMIVYERLQSGEVLKGFIGLVYRTDAIADRLFANNILQHYAFSLTDRGRPVLERGTPDTAGPMMVTLDIPVADRMWVLRMAPAAPPPSGPIVLLVVGVGLSIATAFAVRALVLRHQSLRAQQMHLEDTVRMRTAELRAEVAERTRAQRAMQVAKEEAERANEDKSQFFAAASHDLRQPLQAAAMYAHVLRMRLGDDKDQEILASISRAIESLNDLIQAFLDISRLNAGTIVPRREVVDLDILLAHLAEEFEPMATERGLDLRFVSSGRHIESDPLLLYRILGNLISNALRYTPAGRVLVGCRPAGDKIRIQVVDTGVGIPDEERARVFQEFYQAAGRKGQGKDRGFGLGLSVVRRLADLLGHELSIRSRIGRGTLVEVVVPRARPQESESRPASVSTAAPGDVSAAVMVVEDEPEVRASLVSMLQSVGCTTIDGGSAAEAVASARAGGFVPDVVLADFRLADGETGLDAVRRIHAEIGPATGIILTGELGEDVLRQVQRAGLVLLHKPVSADELCDAIRQATSSPAAADCDPADDEGC